MCRMDMFDEGQRPSVFEPRVRRTLGYRPTHSPLPVQLQRSCVRRRMIHILRHAAIHRPSFDPHGVLHQRERTRLPRFGVSLRSARVSGRVRQDARLPAHPDRRCRGSRASSDHIVSHAGDCRVCERGQTCLHELDSEARRVVRPISLANRVWMFLRIGIEFERRFTIHCKARGASSKDHVSGRIP